MFRKYSFILMLSILAMPAFSASSEKSSAYSKGAKIILQFHTMYGVNGPFLSHNPSVDSDPTVRGILGDYQPWQIAKSVEGKLFSNGKLIINIKGLIFNNPPPANNDNDEDHFRALVSCQTAPDGAASPFSTFITDPFSVHKPIGKGNANIKAQINHLPDPCLAPVVMILNGDHNEGDVWFAVTGN